MKQNSFLILLMISACLINSGCRKVDPVEGDSITENDSDALIVINTPRYGETYEPGNVMQIQWESTPSVKRVNIELYRKTELIEVLTTKLQNNGSYKWKIPFLISQSHHYKVKVINTYNAEVYSLSGVFSILSE